MGIPTTSAQYSQHECVPGSFRVVDVTASAYRARIAGPAVVVLTKLSLWLRSDRGGETKRLFSVYRLREETWVRVSEELLVAQGDRVALDVANMDRDMDDEVVLRHLGGGQAGNDTLEIRDFAAGTWTKTSLPEGDQQRLVDVDGDGTREVVAYHRLATALRAPCNGSRVLRPAVYVYRNGGFALGLTPFRGFYESELRKAEHAFIDAGSSSLRRPARNYQLAVYAELIRSLRRSIETTAR